MQIRLRIESKQRRSGIAVHVGDLPDQIGLRLHGLDALHFLFQRRSAFFLDGAFVHARGVERAYQSFSWRLRRARLREDVAQNVEIALEQFAEPSPERLVGGNRIVLHPRAARVLVKIDAGIDRLVHRIHVEAGNLLGKDRLVSGSISLRKTDQGREQQNKSAKHTGGHTVVPSRREL